MKAVLLVVLGCLALSPFAAARGANPKSVSSDHVLMIDGSRIQYRATVESFTVHGSSDDPSANLVVTSYERTNVPDPQARPVVFMFNGGPSVAAIGVHMQFGPIAASEADAEGKVDFSENGDSILNVADLVAFDPVETGYSRIRAGADRSEFYSVSGDAKALVDLIGQWRRRHDREASPLYLLGESYGSIRQTVAGKMLENEGVPLAGQIILGESTFLMETSRRTHNIVSSAVSFPLLAMTAAYHDLASKNGLDRADFLDQVYDFSIREYLPALARGDSLSAVERRELGKRLSDYSGIPAEYYLTHGMTIAKHVFNHKLIPGHVLDANDTRKVLPDPGDQTLEQKRAASRAKLDREYRIPYTRLMRDVLKFDPGEMRYRVSAPDAFVQWRWGNGCNDYIASAGLCVPGGELPSVFADYDWPEVLKSQFDNPDFRVMVIAGYYDGLSSIGTHRYLKAQLAFPEKRFRLREYPGGHMTAADLHSKPLIAQDVRAFVTHSPLATRD